MTDPDHVRQLWMRREDPEALSFLRNALLLTPVPPPSLMSLDLRVLTRNGTARRRATRSLPAHRVGRLRQVRIAQGARAAPALARRARGALYASERSHVGLSGREAVVRAAIVVKSPKEDPAWPATSRPYRVSARLSSSSTPRRQWSRAKCTGAWNI